MSTSGCILKSVRAVEEVERRILVGLNEFGWNELNSDAEASGISIEVLVARLLDRFIVRLGNHSEASDRSTAVPDLARDPQGSRPIELAVDLTAEQAVAFAAEAAWQEVSIRQLVQHALFVELDAGEVLRGFKPPPRSPRGASPGPARRRN